MTYIDNGRQLTTPTKRIAYFIGGAALVVANAGLAQESFALAAEVEPGDMAAGLQKVVVSATRTRDLTGIAATSSEGLITREELEARPAYRVGQLLESVPGLVVTAHSGEGKANQYLLRGFNLDHGTDLATWVDGMPVNSRTHAHGQGYTDLNFVIPELAGAVRFTKGPYFASEGDFSSVGTNHIKYRDRIDNEVSVTKGPAGDARVFAGGSFGSGDGNVLAAAEAVRFDGPWEHPDGVRKANAVLRYSQGDPANGLSITAMAYRNRWNATTDQPLRAVSAGLIGPFGTLDPSDGGRAERYSVSGRLARSGEAWHLKASAYAVRSKLTLWNDFTHYLVDPVLGDQHGQDDSRTVRGGQASASHASSDAVTTIGVQARSDDIAVDLLHTAGRQPLATERANRVRENSVGVYVDNTTNWTTWFRSILGAREDYFHTRDTDLALPANSAVQHQALFQPKLSLVFGPFAGTEFFVSAGRGFHSNDARSGIDESGTAYIRPPLLVRSAGSEIGVRSTRFAGLDWSATVFQIDFDSELVYNGDAGATEAGRPSRRTGVELSGQYRPAPWLAFTGNVALARARYKDYSEEGNNIEDSPDLVASAAVLVENLGPWSGALTLRKLGQHPLNSDNSVRSNGYAEWNAWVGYSLSPTLKVRLEVFNLADARTNAADYFYASRLPGEAAEGVDDLHSHPLERRSGRLTISKTF
jgi:hypothetical protein